MRALLQILGYDLGAIQTIESVSFGLVWGWAALVLLLVLLVPLFFWTYRRFEGKPITLLLSGVLLGLRLLFVAGVLILLAGLRCTVTGWVPQKNQLAVLIDSSRSMSIPEEGMTRLERVRYSLVEGGLLNRLEQKTGISPVLFSFSGSVAPLAREDVSSFSILAEGSQTNLTKAVNEVCEHLGEGNLLGLVVLTDGAHNTGESPLEGLVHLRTPLHFLGAGRMGQTKDLSVTLERPPAIGYLNTMVRVRGEIHLFHIATDSIIVEIRRDGKTVDSIKVPIGQGENRAGFAFNVPCDTEGTFTYSAAVPHLDGELTLENNESSFLIKVVKERLKVVILANSPSWDQAFLKAAVKSDPNSHVNAWIRITDQRWSRTEDFVLKGPATTPDLTADLEDADVLVLDGLPEKFLHPFADAINKRIESGKMGLFILPSSKGYKFLGYPGSGLASLFPVDLAAENWRGIPANLLLPSADPAYGFLRLLDDPMENSMFFKALPKMEGLFTYGNLKLGAEILLQSTLDQSGRPAPAMVHHRVGQGNVVMLMGGPLWPMGFKLVPTDKTIKPYTAFVMNLFKWLANRREDALVTLEAASARGFVGQPSTFRVWVMDNRRQYVSSAQVSAVVSAKGRESQTLNFIGTSEKGCYEATFVPPYRGLFKVEVTARSQGKVLGEAKGDFLVEMPTVEFDNPEVQVDLMKRLASDTHGSYYPIEDAGSLMNSLQAIPGHKQESKVLDVRDSFWVLLVLLTLPLAEWILRRTKGFS